MENKWGNNGNIDRLYFSWAPKSLQMVTAAIKLKDSCSLKVKLWPTRQHTKKQRHCFANKGLSNQSYDFPVVMHECELDYKESWALKNWCCWTVVLEKTLESPLNCKEIQPVYPKGYQSWIFIGRTDAEAEMPIFWPSTAKNWLILKDPDAERLKVGGQEDDRGWDGLMASLTQWTWVWVSSGSWWWTGKPGMLYSMWLQRVGHDQPTELNWNLVWLLHLICLQKPYWQTSLHF